MPRQKKTYSSTLFYPSQFHFTSCQTDIATAYRGNINKLDLFLFFHILSAPHMELDGTQRGEYLQLHSDVLRCLFRDHYRQVIDSLKDHNYIQVDEAHSTYTHTTKRYRLHPRLLDLAKPFSFVCEPVDGHFMRKLGTMSRLNLCPDRTDAARQHIIETTQRIKLIPTPEALAYVARQYARTGNANLPAAYFDYFNANPLKRCGVDAFGHRVHSVVTNLPKCLRKCVRFDSALDTPVVELDLVNSQPFFLSAARSDLLVDFVPEAVEAVPVFKRYEQRDDFLKFKALCASGWVYENMMGKYAMAYGVALNRAYCKKLIYGCFFGDYQLKEASLLTASRTQETEDGKRFFSLFRDAYPSVYQLFKELKLFQWECTINKKGERKPFANNALIAQRLESGVIYSRIVERLMACGYRDILTVHDCLLVKETEAAAVRAIMRQEFHRAGLNPTIQ